MWRRSVRLVRMTLWRHGRDFVMDGTVSKVASAMTELAVDDPRDARIKALKAENDALRRENRVLKIAVAELERVSERDTLTPLYNRRYFITAIHHRMARVQRYGETAAIIYCDVNQLKAINDAWGHAAGDFALIEVARRLAVTIRSSDVAARIGGDEFGLILDHVSEADAREQMRRLAESVAGAPAVYDGQAIPLRADFGLAMLADGKSEEELLALADQDMYAAKMAR
jgi:diguanylate cyclase (GGDEF)-like protein